MYIYTYIYIHKIKITDMQIILIRAIYFHLLKVVKEEKKY